MKQLIKKIAVAICAAVFVCHFTACGFAGIRPVYHFSSQTGNRMTLEIDGIEYQSAYTKWRLLKPYNLIGYVENTHTYAYESKKYPERLFVCIEEYRGEVFPPLFCRSGIILPEFSLDNVDSIEWIGWRELENIESDDFTYGKNAVSDRDVIKEFFNIVTDENRIIDWQYDPESPDDYYGVIFLYNDELPGLGYSISISGKDGEYRTYTNLVGDGTNKYVSIPIELIEKIAGGSIGDGKEQKT